ncbi:PREDICTED: pericentriolar material 1 protein isoform X10 [Corvus brachyrhynchos]|uniref:pericentriolar material 1 protein isoform X10 n=1 Tax=Corvus brachyrhynchos TaxID=85066 RepID=UPI000816737D|nr:PREDICTED: pericentriolar material 1 protein isoform X10 [Corvus brachyrhynchos]
MATGGGPFEEGMNDQDLPSWSNESLDDRLNNTDWGSQQKKANRSSEKNKKKLSGEGETRLTNEISPESSPGMERQKTRTSHSFPHARYMTQMSVPEQAELERLKQRINFSDLDQRSIGSDSQGRATAANNKRQLNENKKPFNFLSLQINTNKSKDPASGSQKKESGVSAQCKELFGAALSKDFLQNCQVPAQEDGRGEQAMDSSQIVSRLVQIRDYIAKASSMRDDLVEKNERSANVERLSHLIDDLKEQEKSYLKFLQKMLARENEEDDVRTIDSAVGSGSVGESTSLNIDVQSEASDTTARDPQQEAKEELENLKKQHDLLKRMLQQQEQLKALQGRQAALLALQHKAEQAIAVLDDSVVTETTGSVSGVSLTSELNEELNDLIQRFHNQLHDSQTQSVPDNRRQAESLSLTREISQSRNSSMSEHQSDEKAQLFNKMRMLQGKKQKMDKLLGELHTLRDQHLNNSSFFPASSSPQRSIDQRSTTSAASGPIGIVTVVNGESNSLASAPYPPDSLVSQNESEEDENLNPTEKLQKLNEVRKRLNELRELVHYYEQTSDMMTDAVNENTKEEEEETEESESDSEHEDPQPVTNIRNPQGISSWSEINSNSNVQCGANNRDGRHLNTDCEINNRSAANIRTLKMSSALDCHNRENDKHLDLPQGEDDEVEEDRVSEDSISSHRSSLGDVAGDAEFEQKINRLIAAKQKLRQLQNLAAMVQDDDPEPQGTIANASNIGDLLGEMEETKQQPNNVRASSNKLKKDVRLNEKAREKFYEAKLQQQQWELKQLQEERRKLIEIQEKIQVLQKACPDLQLSAGLGNCPANRQTSQATSSPAMNECNTGKPLIECDESVPVGNELWSEMRRHEILREELRQRRKQLEALMAEDQRRRELAETISTVAASVKSEGSEAQCTPQQSRTEKTMATWGGSTQCALEEENGDEDGYLSDGVGQAEEEEEDASSLNDSFSVYPNNNVPENTYFVKENKDRWKNCRPLSADGNYRPVSKARQQQNISMRRQENFRWMSELSYVEEKEQWQEQINQLKKQHEFSVSICQTLMQDQQTLSCLLQTLLTGPYSMMPNNVASSQIHLIMHQLNQCYTQLTWQQNNVQRLKQMLSDVMRQQEQQCQEKPSRKERGSNVPPPPSPVFCPFNFPPQPVNLFSVPGFTNFSSFAPGINCNPVFPSGFGDFAHNISPHSSEQQEQQHPLDHNTSGKTEYMAFPKPFESSSSNGAEKQRRSHRQPEEELEKRSTWLNDSQEMKKDDQSQLKAGFAVSVQNIASGHKNQSDMNRRREFDEESLESFSSMPDPIDPTTVTKTFRSRKASAQASLASKDKTPKSKNKRKTSSQLKGRVKNTGYESASASSVCEPCKNNKSRHSDDVVHAKVFSKRNQEQLEKIIKYSRSTEMSSAHARRILQQSNRNACIEAPETGSDLSMFEALRDTIYSEVATLISQNESRPHFLIELFHALQLLNTDYLRQRALYALQDIVTRHLSEKNEKGKSAKSLNSATWVASNSELTPSESLASTDDETFGKNFSTEACQDCEQHDADNGSTMSTSSNFEPFATDDLGNTVIHLDKALSWMREYERMKVEAESTLDSEGCSSNFQGASTAKLEGPGTGECQSVLQSGDVSAVPCPRIDTQQLDRQIKAIMKEVIPFLKEHMDEVCSSQLLTSVRRMVLTLTQQNDESKEFVKFFHKQLGSILQDSLAKFAGRKLKDCGEDLLVEISEVLFNELAFFKLMQDLDNNSISVKQRCKRKIETTEVIQSYAKEAKKGLQVDVCSSVEDVDEDKDKDETETAKQVPDSEMCAGNGVPESIRSDASDQEEDEESESGPVAISLSKAETQALTNYGSGEDENEDEEIEFEEGPVDVQTSLQANSETTTENEQTSNQELSKAKSSEILSSEQESVNVKGEQDVAAIVPHYLSVMENTPALTVNTPESFVTATVKTEESSSPLAVNETQTPDTTCAENKSGASSESSMAGSPDTESPVLVNEYEPGSGNVSQKSDEDDFVKVEDLPLKLAVYSETDLMKKMETEAQTNSLSDELLDGGGAQDQELVGDAQTLKEPETFGAQNA